MFGSKKSISRARHSKKFLSSFSNYGAPVALESRRLAAAVFIQANPNMEITAFSGSGTPLDVDWSGTVFGTSSAASASQAQSRDLLDVADCTELSAASNTVTGPVDDPDSNSESVVIECVQTHKDMCVIPDNVVVDTSQATQTIVTSGVSNLHYTLQDLGGPGTGSTTVNFSFSATYQAASQEFQHSQLLFSFSGGPFSVSYSEVSGTFTNSGGGTTVVSNNENVHSITCHASVTMAYGSGIAIAYGSDLTTGIYLPQIGFVDVPGRTISADPSVTFSFSMSVA